MRLNPRAPLLAVVGIACASWASAQSPVGNEFHVNTTIPQSQLRSRVAVDGSGRFTVVWQDGHTDSSNRIAMQRYNADGTPSGAEFAVCATAYNGNFYPDIASDASGNFIVVWNGEGTTGRGVQFRRFSSSGIGSSPTFHLNSYTQANFYTPAVAMGSGSAMAAWPNDQRGTIDARVIPTGQPTGFEFAVSVTTGAMRDPSIAYLPGVNRYVVTWEPQTGSSIYKVFARFVDPGAQAPVGSEFLVSSAGNPNQALPHVAARANGDFVIVWQEGANPSLRLRRFLADGTPVGNDLSLPAAQNIGRPRIAMTEQGDFVVTWSQTDNQVHAQRFDAAANPIGTAFIVNTYTGGRQGRPAVATRGTGDFVITWDSNHDSDGSYGVFGQRFAASGAPLGAQFRINTYTTNSQGSPDVDVDPAGNFVVVWNSGIMQDGSGFGIFGQRFAATGAPAGPEFRVNTNVIFDQFFPSVAVDGSGNFVVAWQSFFWDGDGDGIFGQRYDATGTPLGGEFRVNTTVTYDQERPVTMAQDDGHFLVLWSSWTQGSTGWNVFGQRYAPIVPVELMHLSIE